MNNQYDIKKWDEISMKNLFIWKFFMTGNEVPGWSLTESNTIEEETKTITREYYWENNNTKEEAVKIDVIECLSWKDAQETLLDMLQNHMAMNLPEISSGENRRLGDIAYSGFGITPIHVLFIRANMVVVINSIGKKDIPVPEFAITLDEIFYRKPKPSEKGGLPLIISFSETDRVIMIKDKKTVGLTIDAGDPSERPVWFKLFVEKGEIFREGDHLFYTADDKKANKLSVFVTNDRGGVSEKTIDLKM